MTKVAIYTICWNEELLLPFFLSHYKKRFPNAEINIYDNMSTDKSPQIILDSGCNLIQYDTNDKLNDVEYLKIKNHAWRQSEADWVLVCDMDEFIDIDIDQLEQESNSGYNLIQSACYNMINLSDDPNNTDISNIKYGFRHAYWKLPSNYDKIMLWNLHEIKLITYNAGAHVCSPYPKDGFIPKISEKKYPMYHYKYIGENYYVNRISQYAKRLSDENKEKNWATGYLADPSVHRKHFQNIKYRNDLFKVLDKNIKDDIVLKNQQKVINLNGLCRDANKDIANYIAKSLGVDKTSQVCRCGQADDMKKALVLENVSRCNVDMETFGYQNVICTFEDIFSEDLFEENDRTLYVLPDIVTLLSYRRNKWGEGMAESPRYFSQVKDIISNWKKMARMPHDKIINYNKWVEDESYRQHISKKLNIEFVADFSPKKISLQKNLDYDLKKIISDDEELIKLNDDIFEVDTKKIISPKITKHICFFYKFERIKFLKQVVEATDKYPCKTDIFIHTNNFEFDLKSLNCSYGNGSINFIYHDMSKTDPFLLSHKCRDLLKEQKDEYDIFMYSEDDILITKENIEYWFKYYFDISEKQSNLGFLRVENYKNEDYVCDVIYELYKVRSVGDFRCVINHLVPYCAFWMYDKKTFNYWVSNPDWYDPAKIPRYGVREKSAIGMCGIVPSIFRFTYIPITEQNQPVLGSKVIHLDPRFAMVDKYPNGQRCEFAKIPFNKIVKKEIEEE